jgi:hypothetical protein
MKRIATSVLASLLLLSACGSDSTKTPSAAPAKSTANPSGAPAESAKPMADSTKPAEMAKAPAESAKPPTETAKPMTETAKPTTDSATPPAETTKTPTETPKPAAKVDMDADIKALMAKPEQPDANIEIQHVLIAFKGSGVPTATRTKEEAKTLAEQVYAEAIGGGDFDALVKKHTNDSAPGIYPLSQASRKRMVKGFGDVGWRLKVGEIGVAPWDAAASPYGWHIIKRLK